MRPARSAWTCAEAAERSTAALAAVEEPLPRCASSWTALLDDEAEELETADRARIEGAARGLDRRALMTLPAWRAMLRAIDEDAEGERRTSSTGSTRPSSTAAWSMPACAATGSTRPSPFALTRCVAPAHGVLVTSRHPGAMPG